MPRFFFHARYDVHLVSDPEGLMLTDLASALREALERTEWLHKDDHYLKSNFSFFYEISDENGNLLVKVPINNVM